MLACGVPSERVSCKAEAAPAMLRSHQMPGSVRCISAEGEQCNQAPSRINAAAACLENATMAFIGQQSFVLGSGELHRMFTRTDIWPDPEKSRGRMWGHSTPGGPVLCLATRLRCCQCPAKRDGEIFFSSHVLFSVLP